LKRTRLQTVVAAATIAGAMLSTGCGSDDGRVGPTYEDSYRHSFAAYECMPQDVKRRFDPVYDRYVVRFRRLAKRAEGRGDQKPWPSDPEFDRLLDRVSGLIAPYFPGGQKHDKACYERAQARWAGQRFLGE
jgi:hypothetical protein